MGVAAGIAGVAGAMVGGVFGGGDDDFDVPDYKTVEVADKFKPINSMKWFDDITGEQFSFIKDDNGDVTVQTKNTSGRQAPDSPIPMNRLNLNLPEVGNLRDFNNRYAAQVAVITEELRDLGNTISVLENTAPELIPQNREFIESFKAANKAAMVKGFDIYQNGIDKKLKQMGIQSSSTALGAQIALARERVDAEINSRLQTAMLADKTKQQTLANQFQIGKQKVERASVEMNRYAEESKNELIARGQDLDVNKLIQQRAAKQSELLLAEEQTRINTELSLRQIRANMLQSRNPTNAAVGLITNTGNQTIQAASADNMANNAKMNSNIALQQAENAAQSNPFGEVLMTGAGALVGGFGSKLGETTGTNLGAKIFKK